MNVDVLNLTSVLLWLAGGIGGPAVVMQILSLFASKWAWWNNLPRAVKFIVPMIVSILIAFGANFLLAKPDLVATLSPFYVILMQTVVAYLASQKQYQRTQLLEATQVAAVAAKSEASIMKSYK